MNTTTARKLFVTLATATALPLPAPCQAATAALPWDQTLIALQAGLIGTVAPAAIGLAFQRGGYSLRGWRARQGRRAPSRIRYRRLHRARRRPPAELRPLLTRFGSNSNSAVLEVHMKLARITKPLRSVQVRVVLTGDLNASVERYARYYEHVHGDSVDTRALIAGILRAFLETDREFHLWSRSADIPPRRVSAPSSSNGSTKAPA
jgi:hypothetical protein